MIIVYISSEKSTFFVASQIQGILPNKRSVTYTLRTNDENKEEDFNVPDELVQLNVNYQLFLETLLMMIRGNDIQ